MAEEKINRNGDEYEYYDAEDGQRYIKIPERFYAKMPKEWVIGRSKYKWVSEKGFFKIVEEVINQRIQDNNDVGAYMLSKNYVVVKTSKWDELSSEGIEQLKKKLDPKREQPESVGRQTGEQTNDSKNTEYIKKELNNYHKIINYYLCIIYKELLNIEKRRYEDLVDQWNIYQEKISIYRTSFVSIMEALGSFAGCTDTISYRELCITLGNKRRQLCTSMGPNVWGDYVNRDRLTSISDFPNLDLEDSTDTASEEENNQSSQELQAKIKTLEKLKKKIESEIKNDNIDKLEKIRKECESEKDNGLFDGYPKKNVDKETDIKQKNEEVSSECETYRSESEKIKNQLREHRLEWEYIKLLGELLRIIEHIVAGPGDDAKEEQWYIDIGQDLKSTVNNHKSTDQNTDGELHFIWVYPDEKLCRREDAECLRKDFISSTANWPGLYFYRGEKDNYTPQTLCCIIPGAVVGK